MVRNVFVFILRHIFVVLLWNKQSYNSFPTMVHAWTQLLLMKRISMVIFDGLSLD